jgi:hypothetical protein
MKTTLRRDPATTIVHYGYVKRFDDRWDDRWVTCCGRGSGIDTVFWSITFEPEGPTCMWCVAKAFM